MFDETLFERWLEAEAERVRQKLKGDEPLSQDDKLIVVILS
jgi:hypothetical protein